MLAGINRVGDLEWEVPIGYVPGMRVPGRFFLSEALSETLEEGAVRQVANVDHAGNREALACHARHPLGVRVSHRRRCRVRYD